MDDYDLEKENDRKENVNAEYIPTKCRITRPPPPKPVTNPLQFVKVAPPPLFKKAHEQIKKVEEMKKERKEVREETEDWQANLDNWKSCRRKRQEHIIERVVEVKKLTEQEEMAKCRRKSKTFNEMLEERNQQGRTKLRIPIYDDSDDLGDLGIGNSSSKNSPNVPDNEKTADQKPETYTTLHDFKETESNKSTSPNQSKLAISPTVKEETTPTHTNTTIDKPKYPPPKSASLDFDTSESSKQYTYEGAIQDYRSRIQNKMKVDESIFHKKEVNKSKEFSEAQAVVPKGEISRRKGVFESSKSVEITHMESTSSRRLSEDFANARSLKDRLKSLENSSDPSQPKIDPDEIRVSVKERLANFDKQIETETKAPRKPEPVKISKYLLEKPFDSCAKNELETSSSYSSQEAENYINKLNMISQDLSNLVETKPSSTPSIESLGVFSDREDSGIHTADVSCSVSQADEPADLDLNIIPECIEKLKVNEEKLIYKSKEIISITEEFLDNLIQEATKEICDQQELKQLQETKKPKIYENILPDNINYISTEFPLYPPRLEAPKSRPPPPPPPDSTEDPPTANVRRMNSTKRIKKEIHSKRSSFLGLEDADNELLDPEEIVEKPPDISSFLLEEQKLEKSLFRKIHDDSSRTGLLSKVESHDSGLDSDRGRSSSNTWCSSVPYHDRQDSEPTNSITSEEDEIIKKEREIIAMVEKEEKCRDKMDYVINSKSLLQKSPTEPGIKSNEFDDSYFSEPLSHYSDEQDLEVLKVRQELFQLEQEELERQRDEILFREGRKARLANRRSFDNICDDMYPTYVNTDFRKTLQMPLSFSKSIGDMPGAYYNEPVKFRQSTLDIQHSVPEQRSFTSNNLLAIDHRKSMPELQHDSTVRSAFISPVSMDRQPIKPSTKPLRTISTPSLKTKPPIMSPKPVVAPRSYNQHWVFQEAEMRRLAEHQNKPKQDKPLPDSVIYTLTQRVQNRVNQSPRRNIPPQPNQDYNNHPIYVNYSQMMSPEPLISGSKKGDTVPDKMLSVSGKKKCSYCSNELGRGAAMIIESLCLFYHMECFKCCVCHVQLGDGRIGTDVRVRNQKLHCHNCYSSDDGIKFSCV
ncbi:uncharacterized protein CG43427 isoform X2 [Anthonomus grandis grandis]|uniref:uncharacterized protein CG43427 isoform X2 n=1 Tax=Anthonomus grandis grandis TaxID=2921223 RepID=UPI0021656A2D|nr:uncharacterized protein CG43427 isoform X2 [Anthonomus grandis grandis]